MEKWDACAFPVNEDDLEGRVCYGGLDLSSTTDLTSFCLVFPPEDEEGKYYVRPYFWLPEETLDLRVRRDHVNYDVWEKQGYIQTTEGNIWVSGSISVRLHSTDGEQCRWYRTLKEWDLMWWLWDRDLHPCHRLPRNL